MKTKNNWENIHVVENDMDVWSVIKDVAESALQEEAFYVCDVGDIVQKHSLWNELMPGIKPHYAVKCNDDINMLEILAALGLGFDCASEGEIAKVLSLNVDPDRIIFANPTKPISHIKCAASAGIYTMTFDNDAELHKIKKWCPQAKLVIRIRCDDPDAQIMLGKKFGCDHLLEAPRLLKLALDLGLNIVGVSFHVGSGCSTPSIFHTAISYCRHVFDVAAKIGFDLHLLDIGGGFPGGRGTSIEAISKIVKSALNQFFPDLSRLNVIAEPGRFFVESAYTLACNVHSVRYGNTTDKSTGTLIPHNMYYINDGVYISFSCVSYLQQRMYPQLLRQCPSDSKVVSSSIWGPTCDSLDLVVEDISLPELNIGDWLVFDDMGAYSLTVASNFNGFTMPKVHMVADKSVYMLLKNILTLSEERMLISNNPNIQYTKY